MIVCVKGLAESITLKDQGSGIWYIGNLYDYILKYSSHILFFL